MFSTSNIRYLRDKRKPGRTQAFFICVVIASFLWLVHALNTYYTYTFRIPVNFKNLPQNKKPMMQLPDYIYTEVRASGLKLGLILLNRPFKPIEVDFNKIKSVSRNRNYVLSASTLNFKNVLKFETAIRHISPDTLYFSEKTGQQKIVPVKVPLFINCREGYGYKRPVLNPGFITIWGDTGLVAGIDTIYTQPLTLNDVHENVSSNLTFIRPDAEVYTSVNETSIFIEVAQLVEQSITLPLSDVNRVPGQQVNIYPPSVRVKFTSIYNTFDESDTSLFKAVIDSRKINKTTHKCPVTLHTVPGNVNVMEIVPPEVEILIFKR